MPEGKTPDYIWQEREGCSILFVFLILLVLGVFGYLASLFSARNVITGPKLPNVSPPPEQATSSPPTTP